MHTVRAFAHRSPALGPAHSPYLALSATRTVFPILAPSLPPIHPCSSSQFLNRISFPFSVPLACRACFLLDPSASSTSPYQPLAPRPLISHHCLDSIPAHRLMSRLSLTVSVPLACRVRFLSVPFSSRISPHSPPTPRSLSVFPFPLTAHRRSSCPVLRLPSFLFTPYSSRHPPPVPHSLSSFPLPQLLPPSPPLSLIATHFSFVCFITYPVFSRFRLSLSDT